MARFFSTILTSLFLIVLFSCKQNKECTECKMERSKLYFSPPGPLILYPDSEMGEFCREEIDSVDALDFYYDVDSSGTTIRYTWFYSCKPIE